MEARADLSCIIVTYNSTKVIDDCMVSLLESGVESSQIYVVDNGSSDGTPAYLSQRYPGTHVIENSENLGFSRANNLAIRESTSDFLMFANPDVAFLPGSVDNLLEELTSSNETGICGPLIVDDRLRPKPESYLVPPNIRGLLLVQTYLWKPVYRVRSLLDQLLQPTRPRRRDALCGACLVVRRRDALKVGGFDEDFFMYAEDVDFCERISQAGLDIIQVLSAKMIHKGGNTYAESPTVFLNSLKSRDDLFLKNSSLPELVSKRLLVMLGLCLRWAAYSLLKYRDPKKYGSLTSRIQEGLRPFFTGRLASRKPLGFPKA